MQRRNAIFVTVAAFTLAACGAEQEAEMPAPRVVETFTLSTAMSGKKRAYPGMVRASERSSLSFEAPGVILALNVDLGDTFKAGDTLGTVDARQANLGLESAKAELREVVAERDDAKLDFDRRASLRGTGAIAPAAIDAAEARLDRAEARVEALQASVATARDRIEDTRIIAPFDGEVVARLREPSEIVSTGQPVLQVVGDGASLEVVSNLPKRSIALLKIGDELDVSGVNGPSAKATVIEVGRDAGVSGLYPVTLTFENESLRTGERVSVSVPTERAAVELTIPLTAYIPRANNDEATVFVVQEADRRVKETTVILGPVSEDGAVVLSGLEAGDRIAARGLAVLRDGETVAVANSAITRYNQ